ncbi:MAG: XRE family transcriptional regulator [Alphaproteobacteria bacterium]|nr:MAG: XRE family transcriptional regulator [Alphaproteobacteria bacterium]
MESVYDKDYRKIVDLLIAARKKAGIRQVDLAAKLNKPQPFVSRYETYERRLDIVEFMHICRLIKADYQAILSAVFGGKR